jgi:hypothetical protein
LVPAVSVRARLASSIHGASGTSVVIGEPLSLVGSV